MIDPFISQKNKFHEAINRLELELARWAEKYGEEKDFVQQRIQTINDLKEFYNEALKIIRVMQEAEKPMNSVNDHLREENKRLRLMIQCTGWDVSDITHIPRSDLIDMQRAISIDRAKANQPHLF